jgi:hypothetical protein
MDASEGTFLSTVLTDYPELVAIVVAVVGLVVARLAGTLTERLLAAVNRLLARTAQGRDQLLPDRAVGWIAALAFWSVLAFALLLVLRILGTGRVFTWIDAPLAYLPRAFVGLTIIGVAHVLGVAARNLVVRLQGDAPDARIAPRLVQGAILVLGIVTGVQHMGLDVSFVADLLLVVIGVTFAGLALAFALGARSHVANLLARASTARFAPGDRIRIDDVEGTIIEAHRTGIDLSAREGVVTVPAARFDEAIVLRFEEAPEDDEPGAPWS